MSDDGFADITTSVSSTKEIAELLEALKSSPKESIDPDGAEAFRATQKLTAIAKVIRLWSKKELKFEMPKRVSESNVSKARATAALVEIEKILKNER